MGGDTMVEEIGVPAVVPFPLDDGKDGGKLYQLFTTSSNILCNGSNIIGILERIELTMQQTMERAEISKGAEYFLKQMLPILTQNLLQRSNYDKDYPFDRVAQYFLEVIKLIVHFLDYYWDEHFDLLTALFTFHYGFFLQFGHERVYSPVRNVNATIYANRKDPSWNISKYVYQNINYFAEIEGFQKLLGGLSKVDLTLEQLRLIIKPIAMIKDLVLEKVLFEIVPPIRNAAINILLGLSNEEIKTAKKNTVLEILYNLKILMLEIDPQNGMEKIDRLQLSVILKFFQSPYLEKRLYGLNEIKGYIRKLQPTPEEIQANQVETTWVTPAFLVDWIRKNNIMEQLYQNVHPEIIRRCIEIPQFLASQGNITPADIDLIWSAGVDKHESVQSVVFNSIATFAEKLSVEHLQYLFALIKTIPYQNYDNHIMALLRRFSITAINSNSRAPEPCYYGLDISWDLIQDRILVSAEIKQYAYKLLKDFLAWKECHPRRGPLIQLCLENLRNHQSTVPSLNLLQHIIGTFAGTSPSDASNVIRTLVNDHALLKLLFEELAAFKIQARQVLGDELIVTNWNVANRTYLQEIEERLMFLEFIVSQCPIQLSQEQIDAFWACIVEEAYCAEERDCGYRWIDNVIRANKPYQPFSNELSEYIFDQKLSKLAIYSLSNTGVAVIQSFFRFVNWKQEKIFYDNQKVLLLSFNLHGLDTLWRVAIECGSEENGKSAIQYLVSLLNSAADTIVNQVPEQGEKYIIHCMKEIQLAAQDLTPANELRIVRCLHMLQVLVDEFSTDQLKLRHGSVGRGQELTLKINGFRVEPFTLTMYAFDTVGDLRSTIAQRINTQEELIRLITAGKELKDFGELLVKAGVKSGNTISYTIRQSVPTAQASVPAKRSLGFSPSAILSRSEIFSQLFQALSLNEQIALKVWDLLMLLPTNETLMSQLTSGNQFQVSWTDILDPNSVYKLLYTLQIIDGTIQKAKSERNSDEQKLWCAWFANQGGVAHLALIFLNKRLLLDNNQVAKRKSCFALLMKILVYFSIPSPGANSHLDGERLFVSERITPELFLTNGLQVVQEVAIHAAIPASQEEVAIVRACLQLLYAGCNSHPHIVTLLDQHPGLLPRWIVQVIVECKNEDIRDIAANCIIELANLSEANLEGFLRISLELQSSIVGYCETANQYFFLVNTLISNFCKLHPEQITARFWQLTQALYQQLQEHPVLEKNSGTQDFVLSGNLDILCTLVSFSPQFRMEYGERLILEVFEKCLFEIPTAYSAPDNLPPKTKHKATRNVAYRLLQELARDCPRNWNLLVDRFGEHHFRCTCLGQWFYNPAGLEKSISGFVGLLNLGATCYMNSLMQQFFMIPTFRCGILSVHDNPDSKKDLDLVYQLKRMFGHLQESAKKYFDTEQFCSAYGEADGQPFNPRIQMDADEFFNMFFDKLEKQVPKGSKQAQLFTDIFRGQVCNQVISKECEHVSETLENYFTISVTVKGKSSLEESLQLFIEGDMLEGDNKYHCGSCNSSVTALKRYCIGTLPNTLIIHLKRFEFDLDLLCRIKVNDYSQFPDILNMEPYTKEGIAKAEAVAEGREPPLSSRSRAYYEYQIVGILVHSGNAESGHYYSFIKDRDGGNWFQFNDTTVEPFDPSDIPRQCFGGSETVSVYDPAQRKYVPQYRNRIYNAYMLFYQRVQPEPTPTDEMFSLTPANRKQLIQSDIYEAIWKENQVFLRDIYVYDPDYFATILALLRHVESHYSIAQTHYDQELDTSSDLFRAIELGCRFQVKTLCHAKDQTLLADVTNVLKELFRKSLPACKWFLERLIKEFWARDVMLTCSNPTTRELYAQLIIHVLECLAPHEQEFYLETVSPTIVELEEPVPRSSPELLSESTQSLQEMDLEASTDAVITDVQDPAPAIKTTEFDVFLAKGIPRAHVIRFLDKYLDLIEDASSYGRNIPQFFVVLSSFAARGVAEKSYFLCRSVIARVIDFYLGSLSPIKRAKRSDVPFLNSNTMIVFLTELITSCKTPQATELGANGQGLCWTPLDQTMIYEPLFHSKYLGDHNNIPMALKLVGHLLWEDQNFSQALIRVISEGFFNFAITRIESFTGLASVLHSMFSIQDSLHEWRIEWLLDSCLKVIEATYKNPMTTFQIVRVLAEWATEFDSVRLWLFERIDLWIAKWLVVNNFDHVRTACEDLIQALVPSYNFMEPGSQQDSVSAVELLRVDHIYSVMLDMLPMVKSHIGNEVYKFHIKPGEEYSSSPWKLVSYFRILTGCLRTQAEANFLLVHQFSVFMELFFAIDNMAFKLDQNKTGILSVWSRLLDINENNASFIYEIPDFLNGLVNFKVCLMHDPAWLEYNRTSLVMFYRLLSTCCEQDENYLVGVLSTPSFTWATTHMFLTSQYPQVGEQIFRAIVAGAPVIPGIRADYIKLVLQPEDRAYFSHRNALRLLQCLVIAPEDVSLFCQLGGPDQLAQYPELSDELLEFDQDSLALIHCGLEILIKATAWLASGTPLANELAAQWDSKLSLLPPLRYYLDNLVNNQILQLAYDLLLNLSHLDDVFLDNLLQYLLQEHENYQAMLNAPEDQKHLYLTEPRKPSIKAHLPGQEKLNPIEHEYYFLFVHKLSALAVTRFQSSKTSAETTVNLIILLAIETISMRYCHSLFVSLLHNVWKASLPISVTLRENRMLENYVTTVFCNHIILLRIPACFDFLLLCFSSVASRFSPEHKRVICETLGYHMQELEQELAQLESFTPQQIDSLACFYRGLLIVFTDSQIVAQWNPLFERLSTLSAHIVSKGVIAAGESGIELHGLVQKLLGQYLNDSK